MLLLAAHLLLALWAGLAASIHIRSASHSGPGCPQEVDLNWSGSIDDLAVVLNGFNSAVGTGQTVSCELHMVIEGGNPGQKLVLQSVEVLGRLAMSADAEAQFYTSAFWSETAVQQITADTKRSAGGVDYDRNVIIASNINLGSQCVGNDGYVGILNVNFRVVSNAGKISFGTKRSQVTEHLHMSWRNC